MEEMIGGSIRVMGMGGHSPIPATLDDLTTIEQETIEYLESVLGVDMVRIDKYEVHIMKAGAFSWKEIKPKVEQIIEMSSV